MYSIGICDDEKNLAEEASVQTDIMLDIPEKISIEEIDLCSIFCNLFDNAIESCKRVPIKEQRFLKLCAERKAGYLIIYERNAMTGKLKRKNGRIITNKKEISEHGYGLELLRMMSEKYDGKMTVHTYPGIFEIELALEIKDT